jgi:hypothetical protein
MIREPTGHKPTQSVCHRCHKQSITIQDNLCQRCRNVIHYGGYWKGHIIKPVGSNLISIEKTEKEYNGSTVPGGVLD